MYSIAPPLRKRPNWRSWLDYLIWSAWSTFAVEQMYVGLFVIAIIGFLITLILNELERVIIPWKADS
jgi:NitT/TauT family transport system permease protein